MTGTTPRGVSGEQAAARWVRGMFGNIAGHYDLLNHVLSFNLDRRWRARLCSVSRDVLARPDARVLDLCLGGTGDVLAAIEERKKTAVFGSDFCHPMLVAASEKSSRPCLKPTPWLAAGQRLTGPDHHRVRVPQSRQLHHWPRRVYARLKPGWNGRNSRVFAAEKSGFGELYGFFDPRAALGSAASSPAPAKPTPICRHPSESSPVRICRRADARAGFRRVEFERMTGGAVALYSRRK